MIVYYGSTEIVRNPEYDQIAFITQEAIDKLLVFKSADEV